MGAKTVTALIEVLGDDVPRSEDATRALGADLAGVPGVAIRIENPPAEPRGGVKGHAPDILHAVIDYAWPAAAPLVAEAIKNLAARHKRERVRVTVGEHSVEISGDPSEEQLRMLAEVLDELQR